MKQARRRKPHTKPKNSGRFDQAKEVRAIARERVGQVKPAQVIDQTPKKPKHKPPAGTIVDEPE